MTAFAAVDLGASSGRVMRAEITPGGLTLSEVHRFPNIPVRAGSVLHWDVLALWRGVLDGLRACGPVDGIGIDSWAVDYALLDADGALLANPIHYRDARTTGVAESVDALISRDEHYAITGLQRLPFNTIYQLVAARESAALTAADSLLMIPDLFTYWLTGQRVGEVTNASTTGLLNVHARAWSEELIQRLALRGGLLPEVREPGSLVGSLRRWIAEECGTGTATVWTVGTHDTASAVVGVPASSDRFAYISCGTWSLIGVELPAPVTTPEARGANFSNELGVDGTVRFLRNIMGLWLLQESIRAWERGGTIVDLEDLLRAAAEVPARRSVIDPDRPEFLHPGDMPARMQTECRRTDQPVPRTPAEITRCILDSLADVYCRTIDEAAQLSGRPIEVIHLVGGGAQNELLCQLTADACRRPVIAGPVEAAAYGNVLVQARAAGAARGDLADLRDLVPRGQLKTYLPRSTYRLTC